MGRRTARCRRRHDPWTDHRIHDRGGYGGDPEALSVPWLYLMVAIVSSFACGAIAIALMQTRSSKPDLEALRAG